MIRKVCNSIAYFFYLAAIVIWSYYEVACIWMVTIALVLLIVIGGEVSYHLEWERFVDDLKSIF